MAEGHFFETSDVWGDLSSLITSPQSVPERGHDSSGPVRHQRTDGDMVPFSNQTHSRDFSRIEVLGPLRGGLFLRPPRSFRPRKVQHRHLSLNRKYVICTLSAYPHMMLPGKDLPPFIHPRWQIKSDCEDGRVSQTSLPDPLAACSGIIAMWSVKNENNSGFIWKAIRSEQEKISEEVGSSWFMHG
jgi:hypothetical protein